MSTKFQAYPACWIVASKLLVFFHKEDVPNEVATSTQTRRMKISEIAFGGNSKDLLVIENISEMKNIDQDD